MQFTICNYQIVNFYHYKKHTIQNKWLKKEIMITKVVNYQLKISNKTNTTNT